MSKSNELAKLNSDYTWNRIEHMYMNMNIGKKKKNVDDIRIARRLSSIAAWRPAAVADGKKPPRHRLTTSIPESAVWRFTAARSRPSRACRQMVMPLTPRFGNSTRHWSRFRGLVVMVWTQSRLMCDYKGLLLIAGKSVLSDHLGR